MPNPTAAMLVIGDEILSGRTRDANMHHLAGRLTDHGIDLKEVRVVVRRPRGDRGAVNALRTRSTTSSPRAASAPPMTTSPPMPSARPSASPSTCAPMPARSCEARITGRAPR
jgi:hypothetical protein